MRSTWARMVLVAVLATTALGLGSRAIAQQASDLRVYVNLKDADMVTATRTLTQQAGVQFLIEPSNEPFGRVTLKLDGQTADDAVRYICQAAGAYFRRDENGVFIISHRKFEAPVVVTPAAKPVFRKLKVLKASAQDIFDSIVRQQAYDSLKGFEELKRFTSLSNNDVARIWGPGVNPNQTLPNQVYKPVGVDVTTSRPLTGAETSGESGNDIQLPGEAANQYGRGGGIGGGGIGGGGIGGQGGFGGGIGGQGGRGGGLGGGLGGGGGIGGQGGAGGNLLQPNSGLIPDGIDYINYDPSDNSIVVMGTEQAIADLQQRIGIFDVAPRQVIIKVEFITTTAKLQDEMGWNFTYNRGAFVTGFQPALPTGSGSAFLSWGTGNWAIRLRAALTENNGTVVNAPMVRTFNNQPAIAFFNTQIPLFVPTTVINNNQTLVQYQTQYLTVATGISVTPRINDDDTISMYLTPSISDITGFSTAPDGTPAPNLATQTVAVATRVRNNETIVLAGFNGKQYSTTITRVPILSDLPIIGQFFRSRSKNNSNSELLIFVTPHIVDEDTMSGPGGP